jgi:predicted site-specific integrase-resolvase
VNISKVDTGWKKTEKTEKKALASSSSSSSNYIQPKTAVRQYGISHTTLVKWARDGKIRSIRTGDGFTSGHRYNEEDLKVHLKVPLASQETEGRHRLIVLYARVSSQKQKDAGDLQRQIDLLKHEFPNHDQLVVDVASGLDFKRRGLLSLLDLVEAGSVSQVVVTYKDRLARFGTDLIERAIRKHGATLHVVSHAEDPGTHAIDDSKELADDLLAVCNFFVARNNGRRAAALRRGRQSRQPEDTEDSQESSSSSEGDEDPAPCAKRPRPRDTT